MPTVGRVTGITNIQNVLDSQRIFNKLKGRLNELQDSVSELSDELDAAIAQEQADADYNQAVGEEVTTGYGMWYRYNPSGERNPYNPSGNEPPDNGAIVTVSIVNRKYGEDRDGDKYTISVADVTDIELTEEIGTTGTYTYHHQYKTQYELTVESGEDTVLLIIESSEYETWTESLDGDGNVYVKTWILSQELLINNIICINYYVDNRSSTSGGVITPAVRPDGDPDYDMQADWGYDEELITAGLPEQYTEWDKWNSEDDKEFVTLFFPITAVQEAEPVIIDYDVGEYTGSNQELGEDWVFNATGGYPTQIKLRYAVQLGSEVETINTEVYIPIDDFTGEVVEHKVFSSDIIVTNDEYIDVGIWPTKGSPASSDLEVVTIIGEII